jgi:hypothetical protein
VLNASSDDDDDDDVENCFCVFRCSSLMLSVSHLAMLAKSACSLSGVIDWVDQSLADAEEHLKVDFNISFLKTVCRSLGCNCVWK